VPGHARRHSAVSCAKMAEHVEMLFCFGTRVGRMKRKQCGLMSNYFDHLLLLGHIAALLTDRLAWSVCLSVTVVNPTKTAEPIEMSYGLRIRVGPGNHVLDRGPDPSWEGPF